MNLKIGERVKELRTKNNISISELSKLSGVSTGLISQIERDMVSPSVVNLYKIASALDTNISFFFSDSKEPFTLIKNGSHRIMMTDEESKTYQLLSPGQPENELDMAIITIKKNDLLDHTMVTHKGEECGYVLSGRLTIFIDDEKLVLEKGDSIHFKSLAPHVFINEDEEDCVSIWSMTPKFF